MRFRSTIRDDWCCQGGRYRVPYVDYGFYFKPNRITKGLVDNVEHMRKSKEDESEDKYAEGPIKGIWKVIARVGDPSCGGL